MSGFRDELGMRVTPVGDGRAQVQLTATDAHLNPNGTVHGGVLATLADVASAEAVAAGADTESGITIELKITYLSPAHAGELLADAHVIKRGRTITIVETEIKQDEEWVAHAIGTFTARG